MKFFTIEEANGLIPLVRPTLEKISSLYEQVGVERDEASAAASSADRGGGGMLGGSQYVRHLYEIGKLTTEINELGIQLKDCTRGLIDFPSMRGERVILLCWQLGEPDRIEWWHDLNAGFAGRQPL